MILKGSHAHHTTMSAIPAAIVVSGLPWYFSGWNNIFFRSGTDESGLPIYTLPRYVLYGSMLIAEASVRFDKSREAWWLFKLGEGAVERLSKAEQLFGSHDGISVRSADPAAIFPYQWLPACLIC